MKKQDIFKLQGCLEINVVKDGQVIDKKKIGNLVTIEGRQHVANQLADVAVESIMSHMAIGTGSGQTENDSTLDSEVARVTLLSKSQGAGGNAHQVIYEAIFGEGVGSGNITEAGIFNASSGGTMLCYDSFSAIDKQSNITLLMTWTLSILAS